MFIPPKNIADKIYNDRVETAPIELHKSHLLIDMVLVHESIGNGLNISLVYYENHNKLLIADYEDELFKNLHKSSKYMLKDAKLKKKKSIAIHGLLLDKEIDNSDRSLAYEIDKNMKVITIFL